MKYLQLFIVLTIIILGGFLTQTSAQNYGKSDAVTQTIERKVFKKLKGLPYYGVFDFIAYKVEGSTVTLFGKVAYGRNKKDAAAALKGIDGVGEIINNIEILPLSSFDNSIRRRLLRTFTSRGAGIFRYLQEPNPSVRLIVDGGHVTLEGYVANRGDYNLMNILANGVSDVFSVKNNLIIEKVATR